jgi:hypothetical protein
MDMLLCRPVDNHPIPRRLHLPGHARDEAILILVTQLFERTLLGLGNEQSGENTGEHEKREDLQTVRSL